MAGDWAFVLLAIALSHKVSQVPSLMPQWQRLVQNEQDSRAPAHLGNEASSTFTPTGGSLDSSGVKCSENSLSPLDELKCIPSHWGWRDYQDPSLSLSLQTVLTPMHAMFFHIHILIYTQCLIYNYYKQ